MFKKLIASIVLASFLLVTTLVPFAHAQSTWYLQDYIDWHTRVYDEDNPEEIFGERYTAAQVEWVLYGLIAFIFNHVLTEEAVVTCILEMVQSGSTSLTPECEITITEAINNLNISQSLPENQQYLAAGSISPSQILFGRSLSGIGYLKEAASKFRIVQEAKAQQVGFGFEAAASIRTLWALVRNTTYFLLVLALVAMAFMIMFRVRISPQTVITVQSALPRVIIALILITFSYAIAGFLIDLMYVVFGLIAAILSESELFTSPSDTWSGMYTRLSGTALGYNVFALMMFYFLTFSFISMLALFTNVPGFIGLFFGGTQLIWIILVIIVLIVLFIVMLKILWMLIKTFVTILLLIAVGPIFILGGLVGGSGFSGWVKNLAANLAVFPAVGTMFVLAFLFLGSALPGGVWTPISALFDDAIPYDPVANVLQNSPWGPPFLATGAGIDLDLIWLFASLVIITLIPRVAEIIKGIISGRPMAYGAAVGAALGAGAGVAAYPFVSAWGATSEARRKAFTEMVQTRSVEPVREFFRRRSPSK